MVKQVLFILLATMLLTSCVEVTHEAPEGPSGPVCNAPYILVGNDCCLDADDNAICDNDERITPKNTGDSDTADGTGDDDSSDDGADDDTPEPTPSEDVELGSCGDGTCDSDENAASCCDDCGCDEGFCSDNECKEVEINYELSPLTVWNCGDGTCSDIEDAENCCADCGCEEGLVCSSGMCVELTPIFDLAPVELTPQFFEERSYSEYLVVVLKEFQFLDETEHHKDCLYEDLDCTYNFLFEAMVYAEAENSDNELQKTKWPMAGFASGYDKGAGSHDDAETITSNVPVFALSKENVNGDITIRLLFSESDKDSVLPYIDYSTSYADVKNMFSGKNDLQSEMTLTIQEDQGYRLGVHENSDGKVRIKYEIREVKVLDGMTVKVNLYEAEMSGIPSLIDSIESDDDMEGLLFFRMTNGLYSENNFGVDYGLEHQAVGNYMAETHESDIGLGEPVRFRPSAKFSDYAGPFLYLEYSAFERDKDCRNLDDAPVSCLITRKIANAGVVTDLIWMDDPSLLENLDEEYYKDYYRWDNKGTGFLQTRYVMTREPY